MSKMTERFRELVKGKTDAEIELIKLGCSLTAQEAQAQKEEENANAAARFDASEVTKLTKEVADELVKLVALGLHESVAAAHLGISESTWKEWVDKSAKKSIYRDLSVRIRKATAAFELKLISCIVDASHYRSKALLLEKKFPDRWRSKWAEEGMGLRSPKLEYEDEDD